MGRLLRILAASLLLPAAGPAPPRPAPPLPPLVVCCGEGDSCEAVWEGPWVDMWAGRHGGTNSDFTEAPGWGLQSNEGRAYGRALVPCLWGCRVSFSSAFP